VTRAGDGDTEIDPTVVGAGRSELPTRIPTVYDEVLETLRAGGWTQGRDTHRSRLSLTAAIDVVVGSIDARAPNAAALVRSARMRNHLRELAGVGSLIAWNDDRQRTFADVETLLTMAAVAFPDD
jgi:hypothetical protein